MENIERIWPNYKIVDKIGKGSYGSVYRVKREDMTGQTYSAVKIINIPSDDSKIKELKIAGLDDASIQNQFKQTMEAYLNEIRNMRSLKGAQNIVIIEDYAYLENKESFGYKIYIRMELLESLENRIIKNSTLSRQECIHLGIDIANALISCEQKDIIHRDIKPANIFIDSFGMYKLGDFGQSKQLESSNSTLTSTGTQPYMAPEIRYGQTYDNTVDIYSLGLVLYRFMNRGRGPFVPDQPTYEDFQMADQKRFMKQALPSPCDADTQLSSVILKACAPEPKDRFQSAKDLKQALVYCLEDAKTAVIPEDNRYNSTTVIPKEERYEQPSVQTNEKKNHMINILLIFIILCCVGYLGYQFYQSRTEEESETVYEMDDNGIDIQEEETTSNTQLNTDPEQLCPNSSSTVLTTSDLEGFSSDDAQTAINEIYARHGYIFKTQSILEHFRQYSWYEETYSNMSDVSNQLNDIEKQNIDILKSYT